MSKRPRLLLERYNYALPRRYNANENIIFMTLNFPQTVKRKVDLVKENFVVI